MEPKVRWLEEEIDVMLQTLQCLADQGFRLGVPRIERSPGQTTSQLIITSRIRLAPTLNVVCGVSYKRATNSGGRIDTLVRVAEDTGQLVGRSELAVAVTDVRDGHASVSVKIGPAASLVLLALCDELKIVDHVTVVDKQRVTAAIAEFRIQTIADWSNRFLDARAR